MANLSYQFNTMLPMTDTRKSCGSTNNAEQAKTSTVSIYVCKYVIHFKNEFACLCKIHRAH